MNNIIIEEENFLKDNDLNFLFNIMELREMWFNLDVILFLSDMKDDVILVSN